MHTRTWALSARQSTRLAVVALASAVSLSGCHFGNYEVDPPGPAAIQGYYETQPVSMQVCVKLETTSGTDTPCVPIVPTALNNQSFAYEMFQGTLTDPVFMSYDSSSGLFDLEPPGTLSSNPFIWPMESDDAGDIGTPSGLGGTLDPGLMPDTAPSCTFNVSYVGGGNYTSSGPFTPTSYPLSGRLIMDMDAVFTLTGTCTSLQACYANPSGCDVNDNAIVQAELGTAIQSGAMQATDISNLIDIEYQVSYQ